MSIIIFFKGFMLFFRLWHNRRIQRRGEPWWCNWLSPGWSCPRFPRQLSTLPRLEYFWEHPCGGSLWSCDSTQALIPPTPSNISEHILYENYLTTKIPVPLKVPINYRRLLKKYLKIFFKLLFRNVLLVHKLKHFPSYFCLK